MCTYSRQRTLCCRWEVWNGEMSEMVFDGQEKKRHGHSPNSEKKKGRGHDVRGGGMSTTVAVDSQSKKNLNARHTLKRPNSPPFSFHANNPLEQNTIPRRTTEASRKKGRNEPDKEIIVGRIRHYSSHIGHRGQEPITHTHGHNHA